MATFNAFNDRLHAKGYGVFAGGPGFPNTATVIDGCGEKATRPPTSSWRSDAPLRVRMYAIGGSRFGRFLELGAAAKAAPNVPCANGGDGVFDTGGAAASDANLGVNRAFGCHITQHWYIRHAPVD